MVCSRKRRFEEDERQSIPNVLQGEVARLDPKFLVNLDPSHCSNNGTVHLICKLGEWPGVGVGQFAVHAGGLSPGPVHLQLVLCSRGLLTAALPPCHPSPNSQVPQSLTMHVYLSFSQK